MGKKRDRKRRKEALVNAVIADIIAEHHSMMFGDGSGDGPRGLKFIIGTTSTEEGG